MQPFDGETIVPKRDNAPLMVVLRAVLAFGKEHINEWVTLDQTARGINLPASDHGNLHARWGDLRKPKHGSYCITAKAAPGRLWHYRFRYSIAEARIVMNERGEVQFVLNDEGQKIPWRAVYR